MNHISIFYLYSLNNVQEGDTISEEVPVQLQWIEAFRKQLENRELIPHYTQWICTHRCNFRCAHCGTDAAEARPDELTTEEIKGVLDDLAELKTRDFSITGGEPLMREDLFEVIHYANDLGLNTGFVSNGYLFDKFKDQLASAGMHSCLISVDGYKEVHDRVRNVPGSYDKCMDAIKMLTDLGVQTRGVSIVVMEENVNEIPLLMQDAWDHGANKMRIQNIIPEGRAKGRGTSMELAALSMRIVRKARKMGYDIELGEGFGYIGDLEPDVRSFKFFCGCGWGAFIIMANGDVMGCPVMDLPHMKEGNVRERSVKDIWWNEFGKFRDTVYDDLPQTCKDCEHMKVCRGGCWAIRSNGGNTCFLDAAREVMKLEDGDVLPPE